MWHSDSEVKDFAPLENFLRAPIIIEDDFAFKSVAWEIIPFLALSLTIITN